jgi:hypothetical protein
MRLLKPIQFSALEMLQTTLLFGCTPASPKKVLFLERIKSMV